MPTNKLTEFYADLMHDPEKWARFQNEPETMVEEAGLSDEEKKLLMYGPADKLKSYVEEGLGPDAPCAVIGIIVW